MVFMNSVLVVGLLFVGVPPCVLAGWMRNWEGNRLLSVMPTTWKLGVVWKPLNCPTKKKTTWSKNWIPNFQILSENSGKVFFIMFPKSYVGTSLKYTFLYSLDISDTLDIKLQKNMHLGGLPSTNHHQNCCFFLGGKPTYLTKIQAAARCSKWFLPMVESCDFRCGPLVEFRRRRAQDEISYWEIGDRSRICHWWWWWWWWWSSCFTVKRVHFRSLELFFWCYIVIFMSKKGQFWFIFI